MDRAALYQYQLSHLLPDKACGEGRKADPAVGDQDANCRPCISFLNPHRISLRQMRLSLFYR